jgi:DNA polymerase
MVPGRGSIPADLLIIGEAPGQSENVTGKAFVGRSGKLLDIMLKTCGMEKNYYIINTVLCRPCDSKLGPNRQPSKEEILKCSPNIMGIIKKVNPYIVVLAGEIAKEYFSKEFPGAYRIHHPSFLLRTGGIYSPYWLQNIITLQEAVHALQN